MSDIVIGVDGGGTRTRALVADDQGREIVTVEGLQGEDGELDPVQQAFVDHTAFQCSFCTPGFVLAATAFLREHPDGSEEEATSYLAGNLCRCGSYSNIRAAVMDARDRLREGAARRP